MKILFRHLMRFRIALVVLMLLFSFAGFTIAASAQSTTDSDFITIPNTQRTALDENTLAINSSLSTSADAPALISPAGGRTVNGVSLDFRWTASSGTTNFRVTIIKVSNNSVMVDKTVGNVLRFTQYGFANDGSQYKWAVAATNGASWTTSAWQTFISGTATSAPPATPNVTSPLSGATVSGSSINFQWAASSGATAYWLTVIKVSDNSILINKSVGNVLSTIQAGFPNNGTQYKWAVAAGNNVGWKASVWPTFTSGATVPTPPAATTLTSPLSGVTVSGSSINFQWAASSGATGYQLTIIKVSNNAVLINQNLGNVLASTQTGFLNDGAQYKWAVAAVNASGSTASSYWAFTNGSAAPAPPATSTLTSPASGAIVSGTSVNFQWAASTGATGYQLTVIKVSNNTVLINQNLGNVLVSTQTGFLNDGAQYKWAVAAINSTGSTLSSYWTLTNGVATTVAPDAPSLISPAGGRTVNGVSLDFRWTASSGTTNFRVTIIKVSNNAVMVDKTVGNVLRFTQYGFANDGSQYKWAVAATNGAGWTTSAWQTFISGSK